MKAFFALSIYVILLFSSCGGNDESVFAVKQKIAVADRAVVHYNGGKKFEVDHSEAGNLNKLKEAITNKNLPQLKCSNDGNISFYKAEILLYTVEFSVSPDCAYIYYSYNNKLYWKAISAEAKQYLNEIRVK